MQLRAYLLASELTIQAFARAIGVTEQAVYRYVNGERRPRDDVLRRIQTLTKGKVTANDFYGQKLREIA